MKIKVTGQSRKEQIPVFKNLTYNMNGVTKSARIKVNNNLTLEGKERVQTKGTWSQEKEEGFKGDY